MSSTSLLTRDKVCERFGGVTLVTLHRWRADPALNFPAPVKIKRRVFWRQEDIDRWTETRIAPSV